MRLHKLMGTSPSFWIGVGFIPIGSYFEFELWKLND